VARANIKSLFIAIEKMLVSTNISCIMQHNIYACNSTILIAVRETLLINF